MSTYYEYQDAKLAIMEELQARGWNIYGYSPDRSDSYTDYYCPESWDGIAEKNGYILVVNHSRGRDPQEVREYVNANANYANGAIYDKMEKLRKMTTENGATEGEAANAVKMLEVLQSKIKDAEERAKEYIVTGIVPGYMANPPRCNWHLEKDGVYILKGNGILKYSTLYNEYYHYQRYKKSVDLYIKSREEWVKEVTQPQYFYGWETEEQRAKKIESNEKRTKEIINLLEGFRKWMRKIDAAAGCSIGKETEKITYEKVKVTEYKTEYKAFETEQGEVKEGQCFVLKANFNYGHNRGQVFRIHEGERGGQKYYYAYKLNRKRTKELTGMSDTSNRWHTFNEKFEKWIKEGAIAFCEIREVKTPYEVEKVVKKVEKVEDETETKQENERECGTPDNKAKTEAKTEAKAEGITQYTYDIKQDTDTRDNSKIWVVKVLESLDRQAYILLNKYMRELGGYYSKFKHGFLFKSDPTGLFTN